MAKRPRVQTWPIKFVDQATIIKGQNELLLLDLLMSHQELKLNNNPGKLEEVLPSLKERVKLIYQTAKTVKGEFSRKPPTWFSVSQLIKEKYPETCSELISLGRKLKNPKLIDEAKRDLIIITNTVMGIHTDILRIPIPKSAKVPPAGAFILDTNSLNLIRTHQEFKLPDS